MTYILALYYIFSQETIVPATPRSVIIQKNSVWTESLNYHILVIAQVINQHIRFTLLDRDIL